MFKLGKCVLLRKSNYRLKSKLHWNYFAIIENKLNKTQQFCTHFGYWQGFLLIPFLKLKEKLSAKQSIKNVLPKFCEYKTPVFFKFSFKFKKLDFVKTRETQKSGNEVVLHFFS